MILENKYKGNINFKDLVKYTEGGYIRGGGKVCGSGVEISCWGRHQVNERGEGNGMSV